MAEYLVPPHGSCMIKCKDCGGLYMPETLSSTYAESCPFCNCKYNTIEDTIPLWKYNLIKLFRSGRHVDEIESGIINVRKGLNKLGEKYNNNSKQMKAPTFEDAYYYMKVDVTGAGYTEYKFYGFAKSIDILPNPGEMPSERSVYYIEDIGKFVTIMYNRWSVDNEFEEVLRGKKRFDFLKQAYKEIGEKKKKK